MRVRAINLCFVGGARRRPGEVFEVPSSFKSKDVEPADAKDTKVKKAPAEPKSATSFSEMNKSMPVMPGVGS